jgi:catechol 2,3-dioxygenase-like lactoylglutathione lyase family enzyme
MVSIGMVVLNVTDMERAVGFWSKALGYEVREGGAGADWSSLTPAGGLGTGIGLQLGAGAGDEHPRVHLDLYVADAAEQAAEIDRLLTLGAGPVDWDLYPDDPDFVVLADPEGNRFCVVDTSHGHE